MLPKIQPLPAVRFPAHSLFALGCLVLLQSCNGLRPPALQIDPEDYLRHELFPPVAENFVLESPDDLFVLPDSYKRQLDLQVLTQESEYERYKKLRQWAFQRFEDYEFTTMETISLAELNSARKINCLSFSAMYVAAARYSGVSAQFQLVFAPPYWDNRNGSWINNQHINVSGEVDLPDFALEFEDLTDPSAIPVHFGQADFGRSYRYVVDVNPAVVSMRSRRRVISEEEVASLFYSNKSIEQLLLGELGNAFAYTRAALRSDPGSSLAWNNLGVLYGRVHSPNEAIAAFELAIALDDNAHSARSNLARTYRAVGQESLALELEETVSNFRESNPYYLAALAEEEMAAGNYLAAREKFEDALDKKHNEQHFYHQLAIISLQLGDRIGVLENLKSAQRYARGRDKGVFANKLQALETLL